MNIDKLKRKSLTQLLEIKTATESICESYAKRLTDYATINGDVQFRNMPKDTQELYAKRGKFVEFLDCINAVIEEKIMAYYHE